MRMIVFPYGYDCEPIIRHACLLESCYKIVALVSPGGWGCTGKNITLGDSGVSLLVHESFQEVNEEFDSLFIPNFEVSSKKVENRLMDEIIKLIPRLEHVVCVNRFSETNQKRMMEACKQVGVFCELVDFSKHKGAEEYGLTVQ